MDRANEKTIRQAFDLTAAESLEERLTRLRDQSGGSPNKPAPNTKVLKSSPTGAHRNTGAPKRHSARDLAEGDYAVSTDAGTSRAPEDGDVMERKMEEPATAKAPVSNRHTERKSQPFREDQVEDMAHKLRPDVLAGGPDDHLFTVRRRSPWRMFDGAVLAVVGALIIGVAGFVAYQAGWVDDARERLARLGLKAPGLASQLPDIGQVALMVPAPVSKPVPRPRAKPVITPNPFKSQARITVGPTVVAAKPKIIDPPVLDRAPLPPKTPVVKPARIVRAKPPATPPEKTARIIIPDNAAAVPQAATPVDLGPPVRTAGIVIPDNVVIVPQAATPADLGPPQVHPSPASAKPAPSKTVPSPAIRAKLHASRPMPLAPPKTNIPVNTETGLLITKADNLIETGDISAARLLYAYAAQTGDAEAAFKLARAYDPLAIERRAVSGLKPNADKAKTWYRIAAERGDRQAALALKTLVVWLAGVDQLGE